jgi:transposase InsO family protein
MCSGDGTSKGLVYVKSESSAGIQIAAGQELGSADVIGGALRGNASSASGELVDVDDYLNSGTGMLTAVDDDQAARAMAQVTKIEHKFAKLEWLPLTYISTAIFFSGIGGFDIGLQMAFELYGASFKIRLAVDNDEEANGVHERTFPGVLVVKHTLGVSYKKTQDMIAKYVPREEWKHMYWHGSPSCVDGSTVNLLRRDMRKCCKLTEWTVRLFTKCRPRLWTLEQIRPLYKYLSLYTPYVFKVNMREFTGQTSDRWRAIGSSRDLKMQKLGDDEYRKRFRSTKAVLMEAYALRDEEIKLLRNSMKYSRGADGPSFTITSSPIQYGSNGTEFNAIKTPQLLDMMDVKVNAFKWGNMSQTSMLRHGCQCVPPTFSAKMGLSVINAWYDKFEKWNLSIGLEVESKFFKGDGTLHEDVLPDVVMVLEHGIWQVARIAQHDEQRRRKLVCLAHSMQAVWYEDDSVQKPDRRLGTKCKTLADLPKVRQAHTMLSKLSQQPGDFEILPDICSDARPRPDCMPNDTHYVPWSYAMRSKPAGVTPGSRMMTRGTNHARRYPCEYVLNTKDWPQFFKDEEKSCVLFYPRTKLRVKMSPRDVADKFVPYVYEESCPWIEGRHSPPEKHRESCKAVGDEWMAQLDKLLLHDVAEDKALWKRLGRMSLPADCGPGGKDNPRGVSFLMGIDHRTGVPFQCMQDPTIANLWMTLRETFLEISHDRVKGCKLTNIKIAINSADTRVNSHSADLGLATVITGGPCSHGDVVTALESVDAWGQLCKVNRKAGIQHQVGAGLHWSVTFYSDFRCRQTQPYAVQLLDSVTSGTLWSLAEEPKAGAVANATGADSEESKTEITYPPWRDAERDSRGLPLPMQPDDLGPDGKWRVKPATDEEIEATMKQINILENPEVDEAMMRHFKEMIAYSWGMFDATLRPVDSEPVGIQFLDPKQQPIKQQPYRLNAPKLAFLKDTIKEWVNDGIIKPSESPWGFPVVIVPKPQNKGWRMCVDLRKLNEVIKHDSYQSPRNDDALAWLATKKIRSTLDIRWGYHNLMLDYEAQQCMTFTTQLGSYSYVRLPFGLATAGALFQRYMNRCLDKWLWNEAVAVVDDVAMGSDDKDHHMRLVTEIVCTLAEKGFSVKAEKMKLFVDEFVFLGHLSTPDGLKPTEHLVAAVKDMPIPDAQCEDPKKQLRSFLGMASYARKFIKNFATIVQPMNRLLESGVPFVWCDKCQTAWDIVIDALCNAKGVYPPDYDLPLYVRTDACCEGLGAYLFQIVEQEVLRDGKKTMVKTERVIEYWSRSVPKPMRCYDARRLELLAVIMGLEHFKPYIDGVKVFLDTDHRNLTFISNIKHSSGQLARWAMRLSEYNYELRYRPGKHMEVADCLSRLSLPKELSEEEMAVIMATFSVRVNQTTEGRVSEDRTRSRGAEFMVTWGLDPLPVEQEESARAMAAGQDSGDSSDSDDDVMKQMQVDRVKLQACDAVTDEEFKAALAKDSYFGEIKNALSHSDAKVRAKAEKKWRLEDGELFRRGDVDLRYVPQGLRKRVVEIAHSSPFNMHAGRKSTLQDLKARYYWLNMDKDVAVYVRCCLWCRKAKSVLPRKAGLLQQTLHQHSGSLVSIDLVGPLRPTAQGNKYILTVIDAFSHYLIAVPIQAKSAVDVLDAFIQHVVLQGLLPCRMVTTKTSQLVQKGRVVSDNGAEFKNELLQNFLKLYETRFGYSIPYHPQSNPVERVHSYIGQLLRISLNKSDAIHDAWDEALPWIVFSYNKMYIPGTTMSPFLLRNGSHPLYPEDLARHKYVCVNQTFQEKLDQVSSWREVAEQAVREAHEESKRAQKLQYDASHYDVEFPINSYVLWFCDDQKDKLYFKWHGPYKVVKKVSPVKYVIEDVLDGEQRNASVQQIVPFYGEADTGGDDNDVPSRQVIQRELLKKLKKGTYLVFQRPDTYREHGPNALHVGQVDEEYDPVSGSVVLFHYIDMGPNDNMRDYKVTKDIAQRRVYLELVTKNDVSHTNKRGKGKLGNDPALTAAYTADQLTIIAKNFNLPANGRIPADVCMKVKRYLQNARNDDDNDDDSDDD